MSALSTKAREDLVDNYYAELEELAGERLDGLITAHAYTVRHLQILDRYADDLITEGEIGKARIRRYGE